MSNYKNIIPFIKLREGGLSSAQTDTAKNNSSPCGKGSNGHSYHTNKGITWLTFKSNASALGYEASCNNFLKMPDSIWEKIYKKIYWDSMLCDKINNQAIANTFVEWAWGSGVYGATNSLKKFFKEAYNKNFSNIQQIVDFVNELDKKNKTSELFEGLYDWRSDFFKGLNQPANTKGWLKRLSLFYIWNKPFVISKPKVAVATGVVMAVLGTIYIGYKLYGKHSK